MPQVKEPLIRTLVREALKEAELSVGDDNTKFNIKIFVSNPQSETKQGIRIQLKPKDGFLDPDVKDKLSAAVMTKFNNALEQFKLQISLDTDASDPEVMGFFIPLEHIKNMIEVALKGPSAPSPNNNTNTSPTPPPPPKPPLPSDSGVKDDVEEMINEALIEEMRVRDLNEISRVVVKEDFYNFINAGNNVLRTLEENNIPNGKKYLSYLVKHNIM